MLGPVVALTALATLASGLSSYGAVEPSVASQQSHRPNVVIITVDDMRTDDLRYLPNVQRLIARKGTRFTSFYVPLSWCCPSRASMLTGQYPHNHRVLTNAPPLGGFPALRDSQTLATWLHPTYTTGFIGKYLNAYGPSTESSTYVPPGWDTWRASYGTSAFDYMGLRLNANGILQDHSGTYATRVFGNLSRVFIRNHAADPGPLFLWTSFGAPHVGVPHEKEDPKEPPGYGTPYVEPKYRNTYKGPPAPANKSFNELKISDKPGFVRAKPLMGTVKRAATSQSMSQRRESLRSVDDAVGGIIEELRARHQLARTYIFFISDNGYMQGEHRILHGKTLPYDPSSRVPLLVRGPHVPEGVKRSGVFAMPDIAPTILRISGLYDEAELSVDGISILPAFSDRSFGYRRAVLLEAVASDRQSDRRVETRRYDPYNKLQEQTAAKPSIKWRYRAVVTRRWKLTHWTQTGEAELYDRRHDPYELRNLAIRPPYNSTQRALAERLEDLRFCSGSSC